MTENEFWMSPVGQCFHRWAEFMRRTSALGDAVYRSVPMMVPLAKFISRFERTLEKKWPGSHAQVMQAVRLGEEQTESKFALLHGLVLIAAWGAFEAFIEDICLAKLTMEPELLGTDPLGKIKIEVSNLVLDPENLARSILTLGFSNQKSTFKEGRGAFESRLRLVGLDGAVPKELADEIFTAQQVRNVWAHRGGVADQTFVDKSSKGSSYNVGDAVEIGQDAIIKYLAALGVYGTVVVNRYRHANGLPRLDWPGSFPGVPTFNDTHMDLYGEAVTPRSAPDTSEPASDIRS